MLEIIPITRGAKSDRDTGGYGSGTSCASEQEREK